VGDIVKKLFPIVIFGYSWGGIV